MKQNQNRRLESVLRFLRINYDKPSEDQINESRDRWEELKRQID